MLTWDDFAVLAVLVIVFGAMLVFDAWVRRRDR